MFCILMAVYSKFEIKTGISDKQDHPPSYSLEFQQFITLPIQEINISLGDDPA